MTNEEIYIKPKVSLLHVTPLVVADIAGRTAYDSFNKAEHEQVKSFPLTRNIWNTDIDSSKLLNQLAWVHFHHSVLEHINFSFHIQNMSRGVLQELARHRIASYTVRSTRYTMTSILLAYAISQTDYFRGSKYFVFEKLIKAKSTNPFMIQEPRLLSEEISAMYNKLEVIIETTMPNGYHDYLSGAQADILDNIENFDKDEEPGYMLLNLTLAKSKRNSGDPFKAIVTDNWKTELVWTINLRSLRNFNQLRNSGAAFYQMKWLAEAVLKTVPSRYKELISKKEQA